MQVDPNSTCHVSHHIICVSQGIWATDDVRVPCGEELYKSDATHVQRWTEISWLCHRSRNVLRYRVLPYLHVHPKVSPRAGADGGEITRAYDNNGGCVEWLTKPPKCSGERRVPKEQSRKSQVISQSVIAPIGWLVYSNIRVTVNPTASLLLRGKKH